MNLFELKHYILFLLKAKDQYGLHSPFVFATYNKLLERKKQQKGFNKQQIICQIRSILTNYNFISAPNDYTLSFIKQQLQPANNIIVINSPYKDKQSLLCFLQAKEIQQPFITLDFFHVAFFIHNPNILQKQHYKLKI